MAGIAAVHDALSHVYSRAGYVPLLVHVAHPADGPTMNTHANGDSGLIFKRGADFKSRLDSSFWLIKENENHSIPGGHADKLPRLFSAAKTACAFHHPGKLTHYLDLLGDK